MKKLTLFMFILFFSTNVFAENDIDQWTDSKKTYKDLIEDGLKLKLTIQILLILKEA